MKRAMLGFRWLSLGTRFALVAVLLVIVVIIAALAAFAWLGDAFAAGAFAFAIALPLIVVATWPMTRLASLVRALAGTVQSYRTGELSFSVVWPHNDEIRDLVDAHNALGAALRSQRDALIQRELLLDTMVQQSPVAILLREASGRIAFGNLAARQLLAHGKRLEGVLMSALFVDAPEPLRDAFERAGDGLFGIDVDGVTESYYVARSEVRLNGRLHTLFVIRRITYELQREEVRTWKRVIRVISHELNNSLGPIASVASTGAELLRRGNYEQLESVFATIGDRVHHLDEFIQGYARFAKLPAPQPAPHPWAELVQRLRAQFEFRVPEPMPEGEGLFDPAQIEQALINLLRNAIESGSPAGEVALHIRTGVGTASIEVSDRGSGMNEAVLANAVLPFYSTKRGGTGLGLALVREIAEAHRGRVTLANRDGGGLTVTITLPR